MNPNADEIAAAKRVLADAGYLCIHISSDAHWTNCPTTLEDVLDGPGVAVVCDPKDAESQMLAIKRCYGQDC
jgi:hypothetical protein